MAIVEALRAVGATIYQLSGTSNPDLLVRYRGIWQPLEVKSGKAGRLTKNQSAIEWPVVRDVPQALSAIGVKA